MKKNSFFEKCNVWWWGGYYIPVRNSMNYHLDKKHLTDKQKELYEREFGEKVLMDSQFNKWYHKIYSKE